MSREHPSFPGGGEAWGLAHQRSSSPARALRQPARRTEASVRETRTSVRRSQPLGCRTGLTVVSLGCGRDLPWDRTQGQRSAAEEGRRGDCPCRNPSAFVHDNICSCSRIPESGNIRNCKPCLVTTPHIVFLARLPRKGMPAGWISGGSAPLLEPPGNPNGKSSFSWSAHLLT